MGTMPICILALLLCWTLKVETGAAWNQNHINSICSTWGKDHFKTFDGDVYQYPGLCEYNLASDCHESFLEFSVHMKKALVDGHPSISRVVVTIKDLVIILSKNLATVNGEKVVMPYYGSGVLLERNPTYTKVTAKLGLSVLWNGEDAVTLELSSKYANRTCGLCGDFNGIPLYNEFLLEGLEISTIEFGNLQKVHIPTEDCEDPLEEDIEDTAVNTCSGFLARCAQMLQADSWSSCTRVLSPEPYIQACAQDLCSCGDTLDDFCLCSTLAEYSRQCSHAGGTPPNWRTPDFCVKKCPYNMVYLESGSPCLNTCTNTDTKSLCDEHSVDGCFCPEGTVLDDISDRGCIPQDQCQCFHQRSYETGETLLLEHEECTCNQGMWSCKKLQRAGECAVEEGSHITTYDGRTFTFHGDCYYVLSRDCEGSKFTVLGQLVPCGIQESDTCLKTVVLILNNDKSNALVFKSDGKVTHNAEITLPYWTADLTLFRPSSFHILLQTSFGLQLSIQHVPVMQLYVTVDPAYQGKTCGLCGNFNMVLSDDLMTPQGLVEGTASSFASSWKTQGSCPDRADRLDDPCSYSVENENYAEHWCSLLRDRKGRFAACHAEVDPESFYKRCKYSSCNCERSQDCLCAVFSSYVRACTAKNIIIQDWRTDVCDKYSESCPASQTFFYQLQECQRTCRSLASEGQGCSTDFLPVDGCSCPEGLYQDDRGICVPMAKCPCYHNGDHIKPGKTITINNELCMCTNGKLRCQSWKLRSQSCAPPMEFFSCSTANQTEMGRACAKTCRNLNIECFAETCESGCFCPNGLVDDGQGNCVQEEDCPCSHDGKIYASGTRLPYMCNTCTCKRGMWGCTQDKCSGTCTIYGSGHYSTFDERQFGFHGDCGYVAVQDKCGNTTGKGKFSVITENIPCGTTGTTCSKSVKIYLGRTEVMLADGKYEVMDLEEGPAVMYRVRTVGLYLIVESSIGIAVLWDRKTSVRIILEPEHMGAVCGLCGDFDGNGMNDFKTQSQLPVSSSLEFANSWKVSPFCPDAGADLDPCILNPNRHNWAKLQCSIIKGRTFEVCHEKVDPQPYFDNCVMDSCACDTGGDCECFCTAVASYAQACNEAGVCVAWRTPDICPVFCDYYNSPDECEWHYSPCHVPCYKTCLNQNGTCDSALPKLEGCYPRCPPETPIFDEKNQMCVERCDGCYINGTEFSPGDDVPTDELCTSCVCDGYENITCVQKPGCCVYNGTEYKDNDVIYDVSDNMGMCYLAICINETVIFTETPCSPAPPTTTTTTKPPPPPTTTTTETPPPPSTTTETPPPPTTTTTTETPPPPSTTTETPPPPTTTTTTETPPPPSTTTETPPPPTTTTTTETPPPPTTTTTTETPPPPTTTTTTESPTTTAEPPDLIVTGSPVSTAVPSLPQVNSTSPSTTSSSPAGPTPCFCEVNGNIYKPGDVIFNMTHIGAGLCLTMICSDVCELQNTTGPCLNPPTPTPPVPDCPEWDKMQNETFLLCNCTLARCIEDNIIEIIPYECPPLEEIECANGKKPVLVFDEDYCCQHYVCDCFCEGWGDPHYITFDGHFYSFQGNCTYVLMEEKTPKHNLNIYIDNVNCDPGEDVSCPRSIVVAYGTLVVTLKNHNVIGAPKMEVIVDGTPARLPLVHGGVKVLSSGLTMILEIPSLEVVVTFGVTGFSISLPFKHFGKNTQGQCGTCNNNPADDCMLPSGQLVESCALMGDHWPIPDIHRPECIPPSGPKPPVPEATYEPCTPDSLCDLLNSRLFADCHPLIPPDNFYKGCVFDSCHMSNPTVECTSLQSYSAACAQAGICIYWRNYTTKCAADCSGDKVYKPCGPAEPPTCQDNPEDSSTIVVTEGCFCPDGMKLFSKETDICVEKCGCLDPEGVPREFDEEFQYKCQDCVCDRVSGLVRCRPSVCPPPTVTSCSVPGFILVNESNPVNPCCSSLVCRCDSSTCPEKDHSCGAGFTPVVSVPPEKCCPEHTCEPKKVCLHKQVEYQPHATVVMAGCQNCTCTTEEDPSTGLYQIKCLPILCNQDCDPGYKYMELSMYDCCGKCVQTHCIIDINGTMHLLQHGDTWSPAENKCEVYSCVRIKDTFVSTISSIQCPPFHEANCQPGTIQTAADGCCKVCVEKARACKVESMHRHIFYQGCQSAEKVEMTYCEGACNTFSRYSKEMFSKEIFSRDSSCTCCQELRTSNRTISLQCLNGDVLPYTYLHVEDCHCKVSDCFPVAAGLPLPLPPE
nr:mucin-2-like isoform X2 [Paramormyrops kingsleyae]